MHSLRTRITMLTVCLITIAVTVVTLVSVLFIRRSERHDTEQLLLLLCETGERNLNYFFNSVQNSVGKTASFVEADLDGLEPHQLEQHVKRVQKYFDELANKTNGVLTYYYRIDPEVSGDIKGFWYTDLSGDGFISHEVTDISMYDTVDTSKLVWFTVPKNTGRPIWLSPYITDNLGARVISYNVPIYYNRQFVGVVGIEIDYSTMAEQIESIRFYKNGYAFLNDDKGNVFYHPRIDVAALEEGDYPAPPDGIISDSTFLRYSYEGVEKQAAWLPLSNGMRLTVSVPVSETEGEWLKLIQEILLSSVVVLIAMSLFTLYYTGHITRPLENLTAAAELVNEGNYDVCLEAGGKDEVGRLTNTIRKLVESVRENITDLNARVYVDALTSVQNKGAFSAAIEELQAQADGAEEKDAEKKPPVFAIGIFDCNGLKAVNDQFGHEKGDMYLQSACSLIRSVFRNSTVYRIGGDEFAVILQDEDYKNRELLARQFEKVMEETCKASTALWEQVRIAIGIAAYDPPTDAHVIDVVRRADRIMYEDKRAHRTHTNPPEAQSTPAEQV